MKINASIIRLSVIIIPGIAAMLMMGCANPAKMLTVKGLKKVAIVQISSNKTIEWADKENKESTGSNVQSSVKLIGALSSGKSMSDAVTVAEHDARTALDLCSDKISAAIAGGPVPVWAKEDVLTNPAYQALADDVNRASSSIPAANYKLISYDDEKKAELCKALAAEAICVVTIEFKKDIYNGIGASGQAKGEADVIVSLIGADGETLWWDHDLEYSDNSTGMIAGAYKYEEMDNLCAEAAEKATIKIMKNLQAKLAKLKT